MPKEIEVELASDDRGHGGEKRGALAETVQTAGDELPDGRRHGEAS